MKIEIVREGGTPKRLTLTKPMRVGGKLFLEGVIDQARDESTAGVAIAGGIWSGLKYKGSVARAFKSGALIELGLCALSGVKNVVKNYRRESVEDDIRNGVRKYIKVEGGEET